MKLDSILNLKGHDVATITPDKTVADVVATLAERCVGALVVSGDGSSVDGIVTERDIVRTLASHGASVLEQPVSAVMTASVQCAPPSAAVADLMALMTERRFRHVPVIDEDSKMVGIVSIGDIVKNRLGELEGERDALMQYVTNG